jgi:hypothetical protein
MATFNIEEPQEEEKAPQILKITVSEVENLLEPIIEKLNIYKSIIENGRNNTDTSDKENEILLKSRNIIKEEYIGYLNKKSIELYGIDFSKIGIEYQSEIKDQSESYVQWIDSQAKGKVSESRRIIEQIDLNHIGNVSYKDYKNTKKEEEDILTESEYIDSILNKLNGKLKDFEEIEKRETPGKAVKLGKENLNDNGIDSLVSFLGQLIPNSLNNNLTNFEFYFNNGLPLDEEISQEYIKSQLVDNNILESKSKSFLNNLQKIVAADMLAQDMRKQLFDSATKESKINLAKIVFDKEFPENCNINQEVQREIDETVGFTDLPPHFLALFEVKIKNEEQTEFPKEINDLIEKSINLFKKSFLSTIKKVNTKLKM